VQRADKARRYDADKARRYDNEAPEKNPSVRPYWPVSAGIARRGTRLSKKMVRDIVRKVALA
jgi:hypothetical protein